MPWLFRVRVQSNFIQTSCVRDIFLTFSEIAIVVYYFLRIYNGHLYGIVTNKRNWIVINEFLDLTGNPHPNHPGYLKAPNDNLLLTSLFYHGSYAMSSPDMMDPIFSSFHSSVLSLVERYWWVEHSESKNIIKMKIIFFKSPKIVIWNPFYQTT